MEEEKKADFSVSSIEKMSQRIASLPKTAHFDTIKEESMFNHHLPMFDTDVTLLEKALIDHSPFEIISRVPCPKKTMMMGPRKPF